MDIRKLQRAIVDGLEDVKAQQVAVFNTEHLSPLFERVIIASGTSHRQTKALAASVRDSVRSRGLKVLRTEGEDNGEWIIVDCGAAVVHIMQPMIRDYYHLEEIWGGKRVRMKLAGAAAAGLAKASESIDDSLDEAPPSRRRPPVKAPSRPPSKPKAPPRHGAAARPTVAGHGPRQPSRKGAAGKAGPAKAAAAKNRPARATPAKKASAKRVPRKNAAVARRRA